jgi:glycerol transport system ATP-binding protein
MAEIRLDGIAHSYDGGETYALEPLDMTWEDGKAYAILGPSGCGKSTLLNIMSGILQPSEGRVLIDNVDVTETRTAQRNIAQVFQFPVLYETMTVRQNLAFPLKNRGYDKGTIAERVASVAEVLSLTDQLDVKPRRLRADLQQIVSLGRGLVRPDVAAILFDEPLTVIDPTFKWMLRSKLKQMHHETGHTLVYVTHDQTEALTFADEVIVLNAGRVVQQGEPKELFLDPSHEFVGHFIGSPGMNMLPATVEGGVVHVGGQQAGVVADLGDGPATLGVRPEFVTAGGDETGPGVAVASLRVEHRGSYALVYADIAGTEVVAKMEAYTSFAPGAGGYLHFDPARTVLFRQGEVCGRVASGPVREPIAGGN